MSNINKPKPSNIKWSSNVTALEWSKYEQVGYNQACMDWEVYHKYILDSIELCPNPNCDKGKVIMETESSVIDCPACRGRGFRKKG